jgi:hypothetical protein
VAPSGRYGAGVYLTSFTPDKGREAIKKNNLDGLHEKLQYANKTVECYLKFKKEDLDDVRYVQTKGDQVYGLIPTTLTCATFPTTLDIPLTATKKNIILVRQS